MLAKLLFGKGTLKPELKEELEREGLVLIEEGLGGSLRYEHFKAPGKRFHGKVTPERVGLGISKERFVIYCRSGRGKLIDVAFSDPRAQVLEVSTVGDDKIAVRIDYDRFVDAPNVSGIVTIRAKTPNAPSIVEQLRARLAA